MSCKCSCLWCVSTPPLWCQLLMSKVASRLYSKWCPHTHNWSGSKPSNCWDSFYHALHTSKFLFLPLIILTVKSLNFNMAKWMWISTIFSSIKPKLDMGLFVDFCWFICFNQFLHNMLIKSAEQFYEHIMQKPVKTGKYTEINKQSLVKFWLNWKKNIELSHMHSA